MKSPFEDIFQKIHVIVHIRVFGATCYPLLKPYNSNKLQPKTAPCVFLGYALGYKGFICYNPESKKTIISINVIFDDNNFYYQKNSISSSDNVEQVTPFF